MRRSTLLTLALAAFSLALAPATAQAQGNLADVWTLVPKNGLGQGFEAALRDHMQWRTAAGDPWNWSVYSVETGPDVGAYILRSSGHSWADFDTYEADFGPKAGLQVAATFGDMIESVDHQISATDSTRNRQPPNMADMNLFTVVNFYPRAGQVQTANELLNQYMEVIVENNLPEYYVFTSSASGARGPAVITAVFFEENWAGLEDDGSLQAAMLAKYGQKDLEEMGVEFGNAVNRVEDYLLRLRRDLMGGS